MGFTLYWEVRAYSPEEFKKFVVDVKDFTRSNVSVAKQLAMGLEFHEDPMRLTIDYTTRHTESSVFRLPDGDTFEFTKTNEDELVTPYLREVLNIALRDNIITGWSLDASEPSRVSRSERAARRGGAIEGGGKKRRRSKRRSVKRSKRRSVKRSKRH